MARGAKVAGARFYFLTGVGARLELALLNMAVARAVEAGFTPMITPTLVRPEVMAGTGFLGAHAEEVYRLEADDLYLVGTSEVALAGYHADEILDLSSGPLRYAGWSACYRREAGSHGKDTRGIIRVHQFHKVEMFAYCRIEDAADEHERMLAWEEEMLAACELPYRVIDTAAGDLGSSAARKYDCEAWVPSQGRYRELTSTSNCTTFQARRLNVRERVEGGSTRAVATLNGTLATTRWIVALLENHQQDDGTVVVLLVVLQQGHDPPRGRQGSVQRGHGPRRPALDPLAHVQPPRLARGAVRRRRQLPVAALRGHPGLAVVLAGRGRPEVAGRRVDHPVGQLAGIEHRLLPREHPLVLVRGVLDAAVGEHLHLVELVHPDDPPGVLAVRAGLAAVAGRPARVPQRPRRQVEDLVGVVPRERHLRRPDQVQVVGLEPVHLLGVGAEEPGTRHHLGPHQRRRDHRREARLDGACHGHVEQGQLQPGPDAGEEVEAGARHLRAPGHVDRAQRLPQREVVARLEREGCPRADLAQHGEVLLAAGRDAGRHHVRDPPHQGVELCRGVVGQSLSGLHALGQPLGPGDAKQA